MSRGSPGATPGRTLVVTNDFPPRIGGIETLVAQLAADLPADRVVVHTSRTSGDHEHDRRLPYPVVRDPSRVLLPTPRVRDRVLATFREHGCDRVVFGASAPLGLLAPALREAGATHVQALTHGHEVWWAALPGTRGLLRRIGDATDDLTYVSAYCRDRIAPALSPEARGRFRRYEVRVDRSVFHPGCGGAALRQELGLAPDTPVVLCAGRLVRRKGQDTLIQVWDEVRREVPGAVLLLLGDGPDRARLQQLRRWCTDPGSIRFLGPVPHDEVAAYLDAADVFAMPARSRWFGLEVEAFGIVYAEAQACGTRVVTGRSGGVREAVER